MTGAGRRGRVKDDERLLARGLGAARVDPAQLMTLMRLLRHRLEESRAAGTVAPLMSWFHASMARSLAAGPRATLACRMGCAHCCHAWVSARAPEVLFLKRSAPVARSPALRAAVEATYAVTGTLEPDMRDRMGVACPLLAGGVCQLYAARPAVCQTAFSSDAAACARAFRPETSDEPIPAPEFYRNLRWAYSIALAGALRRAGYPARAYELNAALNVALTRDDAEPSWLAGEPVFAGVQVEPGGDPFEVPLIRRLYDEAWADA